MAETAVAGGAKEVSAPKGTRPFAPYEWMLALRYLRARRREAFISVIAGFSFLGIMLGVATLIVVMAVMNGFRTELLDKILGINGHIVLQPIDSPLNDYREVADRIGNVEGVLLAAPLVQGEVLASGAESAQGARVHGIEEADLDRIVSIAKNVNIGTLDNFDTEGGIAIGTRMALNLGVTVGDHVTLVSPKGNVTPIGVTPRIKAYPVQAIFEIGMSEFDSLFVFMPLQEAQLYFNKENTVSFIEVYVEDPDNIDPMITKVEEAAKRPIFTTDWRRRNVTFFSALEVERNVMFMVLTMIILVAALNIVSGLTMLVKDKTSDIAILRTIGTPRNAILRIFFIVGASIGVVGTGAGLILGTVICWNAEAIRQFISSFTRSPVFPPELYYLSKLPAEMDPAETILVVGISLGLSFLATLYPAWRASNLDPVEALRYG